MVAEGAAIVDIGGESTRPGSDGRVARRGAAPRRARARAARRRGARVDRHGEGGGRAARARARRGDGERRHRVPRRPGARRRRRRARRVRLPHAHAGRAAHDAGRIRATTTSRPRSPRSSRSGSRSPSREGVPEERICLDPGIGFGKTVEHNVELDAPPRRAARARAARADRLLAQELARQARRRSGRDDRPAQRERRRGRRGVRARRDDPARARRARARRGARRRARRSRERSPSSCAALRLFGRHGVHAHEKEDGQDFVFDVELDVGERGVVRPARGRGRLPRRRARGAGGLRRALVRPARGARDRRRRRAAAALRRRARASCASRSRRCRPGGLDGTAGVSVSRP